ncbi:MAG: hypothetical protein K8F62_11220 [Pseudorhodoplanes sp.]|nr:hypothetical protein [Pseudorhodoplanes sp.]
MNAVSMLADAEDRRAEDMARATADSADAVRHSKRPYVSVDVLLLQNEIRELTNERRKLTAELRGAEFLLKREREKNGALKHDLAWHQQRVRQLEDQLYYPRETKPAPTFTKLRRRFGQR